jgi:RNA polymerase sigma factor (sigma-70 family)
MATDEELLAACRDGSPDAWVAVHRRYHRLVRSIARAYGLRTHDEEEVVQIVFGVLHQSVHRLRPDSRLAPWLSTVARRHTWRLVEKRRREAPTLIDEQGLVHDDVRLTADRHADDDWLREGLRQLPARSRALIEMLFLREDEPSYAQISDELGIPVGSIGPTRARCLDHLRALLESTQPTERLDVV